jgi:hemoglobin-like flavoprotein
MLNSLLPRHAVATKSDNVLFGSVHRIKRQAMTTESAHRIRASFSLLGPQMPRVTREFYRRLFMARPDVRALFGPDMIAQEKHVAAAVALIVRNLTMLDALAGTFQQLGAEHARAGVRPEHYPAVRDALIDSMSAALTDAWNAPLAEDWRNLLDQIATYMLQGGLSVANGLDVRW